MHATLSRQKSIVPDNVANEDEDEEETQEAARYQLRISTSIQSMVQGFDDGLGDIKWNPIPYHFGHYGFDFSTFWPTIGIGMPGMLRLHLLQFI